MRLNSTYRTDDAHQRMLYVNERDAAFYFHCLIAQDPHASEREELQAAGVNERRIFALYPLAFADVAPAIEQHLSRLPEGYLREGSDEQWRAKPQALIQGETMRHASQDQRAQFVHAHQATRAAIEIDERLRSLQGAINALATDPQSGTDRGESIFNTIFHTWWLMSHRAEFIPEAQQVIDMAMVWAAEHIFFDIHLMLGPVEA